MSERESRARQLKIIVKEVLGAATAYRQGRSLRITFPKKAEAIIAGDRRSGIKNDTYLFIETDKGFLLIPIKQFVKDKGIMGLDLDFDY